MGREEEEARKTSRKPGERRQERWGLLGGGTAGEGEAESSREQEKGTYLQQAFPPLLCPSASLKLAQSSTTSENAVKEIS